MLRPGSGSLGTVAVMEQHESGTVWGTPQPIIITQVSASNVARFVM